MKNRQVLRPEQANNTDLRRETGWRRKKNKANRRVRELKEV